MALKTLEKHELRNVMGGNKWGNAVIGAATGATRGVSSVSYTHLDVYKRQLLMFLKKSELRCLQ